MKLKKRIFLIISLVLFLTVIFAGILFSIFLYCFLEKMFTENEVKFTKNVASNVIQIYTKYYDNSFPAFIKDINNIIFFEKDLKNLLIVNMNGEICFSLNEVIHKQKYLGDKRYIDEYLLSKVHSLDYSYEKYFTDKNLKLRIIQPVLDFYQRHLYSVIFYYSLDSVVKKSIFFFIISFIFFVFLLILNYFFSGIFADYITKPMYTLLDAIKKSRENEFNTNIKIQSDYEMNLLISEFNRMMQFVRNERSLIINIIFSLKAGILALDKNNKILLCNKAFANLLSIGKLPDEEENCFQYFPQITKYEETINMVIKTGIPSSIEGDVFSDLTCSFFHIDILPLNFNNLIYGVIIIVEDITENTQIQKRLVQLQKGELISSLANGLAHDFNNLIGSIKSTVMLANREILEKKAGNFVDISEYLEIIYDVAKNAEDIVKHLLSLSKHKDFIKNKVDLIEVLDKVLRISKTSVDKSVNTKFQNFSDPYCQILGDEILLEEIFFNLIINASHSMTIMRNKDENWGGTINIDIFKVDNFSIHELSKNYQYFNLKDTVQNSFGKSFYKILISDSGVGIDEENFSKIFQPFFSTKPENLGTGLGLSMVQTLIQLHNGLLDLKTEKNVGSTFIVFLPAVDEK